MKRIFFTAVTIMMAVTGAFSQSDKYEGAMKTNIAQLDSGVAKGTISELANNFERIGNAEKTQWLPYYYAAYCTVMASYLNPDKSKTDETADKAEAFITKAEQLAGGENSEICVIKSMIASAHMMVDPQNRWQQYGAASSGNIEKAKKMDPTNPRPIYLDGQSKFYTPEQFGGGKVVAKPVLEKALAMFATFKPASSLAPVWGKASTQYFINECN
ncbi:MAG: hypothetical protein ABIQ88_04990 [Chitinophagaceae bacterium]